MLFLLLMNMWRNLGDQVDQGWLPSWILRKPQWIRTYWILCLIRKVLIQSGVGGLTIVLSCLALLFLSAGKLKSGKAIRCPLSCLLWWLMC